MSNIFDIIFMYNIGVNNKNHNCKSIREKRISINLKMDGGETSLYGKSPI